MATRHNARDEYLSGITTFVWGGNGSLDFGAASGAPGLAEQNGECLTSIAPAAPLS